MKFKDLRFKSSAPNRFDLDGEFGFVYNYGQFNCMYLKAKNADDIIKIMKDTYPTECFTEEQIAFMREISNKVVLVHLCNTYEDNPDVFIYPEDNTPFTVDCFV